MAELTDYDRQRAVKWCEKNNKEPLLRLLKYGNEEWHWFLAGDANEKHCLPWPLGKTCLKWFVSRAAAIDALALVLRDLDTLVGLAEAVEEARREERKRAADVVMKYHDKDCYDRCYCDEIVFDIRTGSPGSQETK